MPIPVQCPSCHRSFKAPDSAAGRIGKCADCGEKFTIRAAVEDPPELPDDEPEALGDVVEPPKPLKPLPRAISGRQGTIIIALLLAMLGLQMTVRPKATEPPTWEYKIVAPNDVLFEIEMGDLGRKGWELVTARRATGEGPGASYEMILKRQIR